MNRLLLEALDAETSNGRSGVDNFVRLTPMEIQGEEVMTWHSHPRDRRDRHQRSAGRLIRARRGAPANGAPARAGAPSNPEISA
jgi:hypothetical protein